MISWLVQIESEIFSGPRIFLNVNGVQYNYISHAKWIDSNNTNKRTMFSYRTQESFFKQTFSAIFGIYISFSILYACSHHSASWFTFVNFTRLFDVWLLVHNFIGFKSSNKHRSENAFPRNSPNNPFTKSFAPGRIKRKI